MPVPGEVYQAAVAFSMPEEQTAMNIYDWLISGGSCTDAELLTGLSTIILNCYNQMISQIHNNVTLSEVRVVQMLWSGTEWIVQRIVGNVYPSFTGSDTGQMLPHACAPVVEFPTTWPRVVGKKYIPGMTEEEQSGSNLQAGTLTALSNFAIALLSGFLPGSASANYCVRRKGGSTAVPLVAFIPPIISSQRRRKPGVGI